MNGQKPPGLPANQPCLTLSSLPTSSQMGARLLQWPLHTHVGEGGAGEGSRSGQCISAVLMQQRRRQHQG
jgi:hypothetical protein